MTPTALPPGCCPTGAARGSRASRRQPRHPRQRDPRQHRLHRDPGDEPPGGRPVGRLDAPDGGGGGIFCHGSAPLVDGNSIHDNVGNLSGVGAGVSLWQGSDATLVRNRIFANVGVTFGGGVLVSRSNPVIDSNFIFENEVDLRGGGVYVSAGFAALPTVRVTGNTIVGNGTPQTIRGGGVAAAEGAVVAVINSILWDNFPMTDDGPAAFDGTSFLTVSHSAVNPSSWAGTGPANIQAGPEARCGAPAGGGLSLPRRRRSVRLCRPAVAHQGGP